MTRFRRSPDIARSTGRVLRFPVHADPHGQFELFAPPPEPDPYSVSQLVIKFTLLQMRITRISSYLDRSERERLIGDYHATLCLVERYEEIVAIRQIREAHALQARIA